MGLKNVLTVTVDNASSNDIAIQHLQKVFNHWECSVLKGEFLHMRCAAHILNLVVKDGLTTLSLPIKKIRALVKYVRSSPARLQKFLVCVEEEKIESKSLVCLDVGTRWNSTYLMLESAVKFKKAFSNLLLKDSSCEKEIRKCVGGLIHEDDWIDVTSLLPFLKIFYEATLRFSGSRYVTSNAYVHEIFGIGTVTNSYTMHDDISISSMALNMKQKYMKYWGDVLRLNQFLLLLWFLTQEENGNILSGLLKKSLLTRVSSKLQIRT
ncbi:putative ribonuclease H-like superfamily, hAT-like transposase, RNase-H [Helianthus annuus]|nr:putative ribonuclease H-like superfamily, hAT-like transposase, RNase-H [Helianthus annuus]